MDDNRPDPSLVSWLDQESAKFNDEQESFEATYGFTHDCTCDADYAAGRLGEAPLCFFGMVEDSLATNKKLAAENRSWAIISNEFSTLAEYFYMRLKEVMDGDSPDSETDSSDV